MHHSLTLLALLATFGLVSTQDNTQPVGTNPVKVSSVRFLGDQNTNSCAPRDLGFTGQLGGQWYAIFGDTLWCAPGVTNPNNNTAGFNGMVRDSIGRCTSNANLVNFTQLNNDKPVPHPNQFIPYNTAWGEAYDTGFGGTSIAAVNSTTATIFYLVNLNNNGLKGAGVAAVTLVNGNPQVTQRMGNQGIWWPSNTIARYGDIASYQDVNSNYIYAWGGPPTSVTNWPSLYNVFQTRVTQANAFNLNQYEYWHGRAKGWVKGVQPPAYNATSAVMWNVGQGSCYYSPFYQTYFFVHLSGNSMAIRTAPSPAGPWTADVTFYTFTPINNSYIYAAAVHPYMDPSGRTLTMTVSNDNHIQIITATFTK